MTDLKRTEKQKMFQKDCQVEMAQERFNARDPFPSRTWKSVFLQTYASALQLLTTYGQSNFLFLYLISIIDHIYFNQNWNFSSRDNDTSWKMFLVSFFNRILESMFLVSKVMSIGLLWDVSLCLVSSVFTVDDVHYQFGIGVTTYNRRYWRWTVSSQQMLLCLLIRIIVWKHWHHRWIIEYMIDW